MYSSACRYLSPLHHRQQQCMQPANPQHVRLTLTTFFSISKQWDCSRKTHNGPPWNGLLNQKEIITENFIFRKGTPRLGWWLEEFLGLIVNHRKNEIVIEMGIDLLIWPGISKLLVDIITLLKTRNFLPSSVSMFSFSANHFVDLHPSPPCVIEYPNSWSLRK